MVTIRTSFSRGLVLLLIMFAAVTGYQYYKVFVWPQTDATVISVRQTCEYTKKKGRRGQDREYPLCDDSAEATRLTSEGYKLWDGRRFRIEAVYETKAGKKIFVTLDEAIKNASAIKPGSMIRIRTSSGSAELAVMPDPLWALLFAGTATMLGAYAYVTRRRSIP